MILLTTGQTGFDRLVKAVDGWADRRRDLMIRAQIANGSYIPRNVANEEKFASPSERLRACAEADLVFADASLALALCAMRHRVPLVVLPRLPALGEIRNLDDCLVAERLAEHPGIWVAQDAHSLGVMADNALATISHGREDIMPAARQRQSLKSAILGVS